MKRGVLNQRIDSTVVIAGKESRKRINVIMKPTTHQQYKGKS